MSHTRVVDLEIFYIIHQFVNSEPFLRKSMKSHPSFIQNVHTKCTLFHCNITHELKDRGMKINNTHL
jgi:hypothetical protein